MTILAGIDYSYTSPSICVYNTDDDLTFDNLKFFNFYRPSKKKGYLEGDYGNINIQVAPIWDSQEERFSNIRDWAVEVLDSENVEEVVIEGYAMGAKGSMVFDIAENTALLKNWIYSNRLKLYKPSPSQVKKIFTGKGNANKSEMVAEFQKRFNVKLHEILGLAEKEEPAKPIDDICDSCANLLTHPYFQKE